MNDNDCGFSSPLAMTVIFSLSVIVLSFFLLVSASGRKLDSYKKAVEARKEADRIIRDIEKEIQALRDTPCDTADGLLVSSLVASACPGFFSVRDVSTGINTELLGRDFCESPGVREYLAEYGESALTEYGWLNPGCADAETVMEVSGDFGTEEPFPLVNSFPLFNMYYMEESFIKSVLQFCGIRNAGEKAAQIEERLSAGMTTDELAALLGVERTHRVFGFLGTKTSFWQVDFETGSCRASAVYAAVPDPADQERVDKYILVEKNVSYMGGVL